MSALSLSHWHKNAMTELTLTRRLQRFLPFLVTDDAKLQYKVVSLALLALFSLLIFAFGVAGDTLNPLLSFDRESMMQGEWYRLVTGNLVHLNVNHMLMNLSVYILAALLFQNTVSLTQWHCAFGMCFIAVGLGLWLFSEPVQNYVGLSGALYGIIIFGVIVNVRENVMVYLLVYGVIVYKVTVQQFPSYDPAEMKSFIGGNVIASAHLYGLVMGHVCAAMVIIRQYCVLKRRS